MQLHVAGIMLLAFALGAGCSSRTGSKSQPSALPTIAQTYDSATNSFKLSYNLEISAKGASEIDYIEIREVDMSVYSTAELSTCAVGIPVKTFNSPLTADETLSGFYLSGRETKFRYVICIRNTNGSTVALVDDQTAASAAQIYGKSFSPVSSSSSSYTATKVTSGQYFTCVLFSNGRVKCWGNNAYGQLGQGHTTTKGDNAGEMGSNLPYIDLGTNGSTALTAIDISAGLNHVCAVLSDGRVKCWGRNYKGQLGLGDTLSRGDGAGEMGNNLPYVSLGTGLTAKSVVLGGDFTCALLKTNKVKCWGDNASGQLGRGNMTVMGDGENEMGDNLAVIDLGTSRTVKTLAAGLEHVCAILDTNQVKCWGLNDIGQLGLSHAVNRGDAANEMGNLLPVVKFGGPDGYRSQATMISAGTSHTCVTTFNYKVKCWGDNFAGQLGRGTKIEALGHLSSHMLRDDDDNDDDWDGKRRKKDEDEDGDEINGDDEDDDRLRSRYVFFDEKKFKKYANPVMRIQVGFYTTCAQMYSSDVLCWGANHYGQLGIGSSTTTWGTTAKQMGKKLKVVDFGSDDYVKSMSSQYGTTCVVTQSNTVKCWGINLNGALGYGDTTHRGGSSSQMGSNLPIVDL